MSTKKKGTKKGTKKKPEKGPETKPVPPVEPSLSSQIASSKGLLPIPKNRKTYFESNYKDEAEDIDDVIKGNSNKVYKKLFNEYKDKMGDVVNIKAKIDNVKEIIKYNKDASKTKKIFYQRDNKSLDNYLKTLTNIYVGKTFDKTFFDPATQKQEQTYVGTSPIIKLEPPPAATTATPAEKPATQPTPPPQPEITNKVIDSFKMFNENQKGAFTAFENELKASSIEDIKNLIRYLRQQQLIKAREMPYTNKYKDQLIKSITEFSKKYIRDNKLSNILEEIEVGAEEESIRKQYEELQQIKKEKKAGPLTEEQEKIELGTALEGEDFNIEEYIRNHPKFSLTRDEMIKNFLLSYDDRQKTVKYEKSSILPKAYNSRTLRDTLDNILLNNVYINRLDKLIDVNKNIKSFKESSQYDKADIINKSIKEDIKADDLNNILKDSEIKALFNNIRKYVGLDDLKRPLTLQEYQDTADTVNKLRVAVNKNEISKIAADIIKYNSIYNTKEDELIKKINDRVNSPADVPVLPPKVEIKPVEAELQSDLDKYSKIQGELAELEKVAPSARTPEYIDQVAALKQQLKQYEKGAKKEKAEKAKKDQMRTQAQKRVGNVRPHFKNVTEAAVEAAIGETPQQQLQDIQNWYIFDIPNDQTGVGNKNDNPLVKQNQVREQMLVSNTDIFSAQTPFILDEGVDERKNFYDSSYSALNKVGIQNGLNNIKWEETKEEFLKRFNDGSNGLFDQDQSKEEVSDFKPIYQRPGRYISGGSDYPLDYTTNQGITENDKQWINNLNIFYKGAVIE